MMALFLSHLLTWTAVLLLTAPWACAWSTRLPTSRAIKTRNSLLTSQKPTSDLDTSTTDQRSIYSYPALYDLAFGYRDFYGEVSFLLRAHRDAVASSKEQDSPLNVLELAAGPARHALEALQDPQHKVATATCIDMSPEMKQYAEKILETESSDQDDDDFASRFSYHLQDMRSFDLGSSATRFDTAWILLGSMQHLTRNQDVLDCFRSVHKALMPGGTLILELPHPRELFGMIDCTRNEWTVPLSPQSEIDEDDEEEDSDDDEDDPDGDKLEIIWGDEDDEFDPIRQVRQATVVIQRTGGEESDEDADGLNALPRTIREVVPMRLFTAQEIDALATCAGFAVVKMFGALEEGVGIDDEEEAFRLVCVLQKQ